MRIYANGCSFTHGDELESPATTAWPALLADYLGANLTNDAVSGGTNPRTVYRTIKHLQEDFDLYLIAWTTDTRFTVYKSDNNFEINFNPQLKNNLYGNNDFYSTWGQTYYTTWYNQLYAFKLWLQQIVQLQAVLGNRQYLMINTMSNSLNKWTASWPNFIDQVKSMINFDVMNDEQIFAEHKEIQYYVGQIDVSKFYKWNQFNVQDLCSEYECGPGGHILEQGHQQLANLVNKHLCLK
jgi:hypothetical protein